MGMGIREYEGVNAVSRNRNDGDRNDQERRQAEHLYFFSLVFLFLDCELQQKLSI